MEYRILTDSSSDLSLELLEEYEALDLVSMPIQIEEVETLDDLGKAFSKDSFYQALRRGVMPKTSQVNTLVFYNVFKKNYNDGVATLYIGLSSGLSGTVNNARIAEDILHDEGIPVEVKIVDSLAASIGLGVLVHEALRRKAQGMSYDTLYQWVEDNKLKVNHWFAVDDLNHLKRGGRIPPALAIVGTVLKVKPILTMNLNGELASYAKIRGRKKSLQFLFGKVQEHYQDASESNVIHLGHADDIQAKDQLLDLVKGRYNQTQVVDDLLSATIATHVGPGMVALAFLGSETRESV